MALQTSLLSIIAEYHRLIAENIERLFVFRRWYWSKKKWLRYPNGNRMKCAIASSMERHMVVCYQRCKAIDFLERHQLPQTKHLLFSRVCLWWMDICSCRHAKWPNRCSKTIKIVIKPLKWILDYNHFPISCIHIFLQWEFSSRFSKVSQTFQMRFIR